jgi:hypothetical protein
LVTPKLKKKKTSLSNLDYFTVRITSERHKERKKERERVRKRERERYKTNEHTNKPLFPIQIP